MSFETNIITPFAGVTLEVGGDVETYWKSTAMPIYPMLLQSTSSRSRHGVTRSAGRPSNSSNTSSAGYPPTVSSLRGNYVYFVVQVTRDLHPVVYTNWLLPESRFDLSVADVTLAQFEALATTLGRDLDAPIDTCAHDWHTLVSQSMTSLSRLMKVRHAQSVKMVELNRH